ncbi:hypothetical protein D3C76_1280590 [compost metagenome]
MVQHTLKWSFWAAWDEKLTRAANAAASRAGKRSWDMVVLQLIKDGQDGSGTANGGLSPGLLSRRVTSTGGRQLSDQPLAIASRNPSQPFANCGAANL